MVFVENVTGLLRFFQPIGEELCSMGYEIEAGIFSASEVGAPHRRERLFVMANTSGERRSGWSNGDKAGDIGKIQTSGSGVPVWPPSPNDFDAWESVIAMRPDLAPVLYGKLNPRFVEWLQGFTIGWTELPGELSKTHRIDRLRALGNAVVPATAELALLTLWNRKINQ